MLRNIWGLFALSIGIGRTIEAILLLFFKVHGRTREQMMKDLAASRAAKIVDSGENVSTKDDSPQ